MIWQTLVLGAVASAAVAGFAQWTGAREHGPNGLPAWPAGLLALALALLSDLAKAPLPGTPWLGEAFRCLAAALFLIGAVQHRERPLALGWWAAAAVLSMVAATTMSALRVALDLDGRPLAGIDAALLLGAAWLSWRSPGAAGVRLRRVAAGAFLVLAAAELTTVLAAWLPAAGAWANGASRLAEATLAMVLVPLTMAAERRSRQMRVAGAQRVGQQFVAAVQSLSEGIALFDERGRLSLCNDSYRRMLAPVADRLEPGASFDDIVHLAGRHGLGAAALGSHSGEIHVKGDRWIEAHNLPTPDGGMVAIRADVTERVRIQAAIRDGEERLRRILDTVGEGIVTIDQRGLVESVNRAASRIFGYLPDEVVGRNVSMLMPEPHRGAHDGYLARYLQTGEPHLIGRGLQVQGLRKDGTSFPVELAVTELRRDEGVLFIGVLRDVTERKAIESALLESEMRFKDLAEAASDWFWETGPDFLFTFVSHRIRQVLGVKTAFFIGRSLLEIAGEEGEAVRATPHLDQIRRHAPFRDFVCRQELPDGRIKHLKMNGRPVFEVTGMFRGYRGTATDITAEVEARASADQAQATLMAALESMSEGFALWDADDRLVLSNEKYRRHFTEPERVIPGMRFTDLIRAMAEAGHIAGARGRPEEWMTERLYAHRHPTGGLEMELANGLWVLANEHVTEDGFVVGIYTDITPLKRREQEIARQIALSQAIIDNMPQGISVFDCDMRLIALNRTAQALFSMAAPVMRAGRTTYRDFLHLLAERGEFGSGDVDELVRREMPQGRAVVPLLSERTRPDGTTIEVRRNGMPDGGFISTYTDISDRKKIERTLREAKEAAERGNRAKAAFLANVSHELRTPLNAIIGFSEIMVGELYGPLGQPKYQDYARDIYESGAHLLNLINDILDMSKAEAGKIEVEDSVFDLASLVHPTLRLVRERADNAKIALNCQIPADLPLLRADQRRFRQILLNLLSNALKFTEEGGTVTLTARLQKDGLAVEVADTGVGMLPEDLTKAMEPFGQVDSRLSRKYDGSGLGLPLTKALVEAHGGTLVLKSVYGCGTRAIALFPPHRVANHADSAPPPVDDACSAATAHVSEES